MFNLISLWWRQEKGALVVVGLCLALNTLIPSLWRDGPRGFIAIIAVIDIMLVLSVVQDFKRANRGKQEDDYGE